MSKYIFVIISVLALIALATAMLFNTADEGQQDTLLVGLQSGYPPFEFVDSKGQIVGFDIDLARHIAEKLGKKLEIKDMEFDGEILSLKQGKIDLIISGMNITPSRLKEILMVPYHGNAATSLSLIFWKKIPEGVTTIKELESLPNHTISVESGTIPEAYLSQYPSIIIKSFQGALAPLMDVKFGKSIATLVESDVAEYLRSQHSEVKILNVPLAKGEAIAGFGIGIKKDNVELFLQIKQIIHELTSSGEMSQLEDKWFEGGRT